MDADGWLFLTDRQDDMIISGGVNVYPQEIEAVIGAVDGVWECAVAGIDDAQFGERPVAFVVPRRGADTAALREAIQQAVDEQLGRIKRPDALHFVDVLPRSPIGKLLRRHLHSLVSRDSPA